MIGENYMKQIILSLKHWVNNNFALKENIPEVPVTSVNNMTGDVIIDIPEHTWKSLPDKPFGYDSEVYTSFDNLSISKSEFYPNGYRYDFGIWGIDRTKPISAGSFVTLTLDGITYSGETKVISLEDLYVGNLNLVNSTKEDTGEDFCILLYYARTNPKILDVYVYLKSGQDSYNNCSLIIDCVEIKYLEEQFIPDTIARVSDIPEHTWESLPDKPFGEKANEKDYFLTLTSIPAHTDMSAYEIENGIGITPIKSNLDYSAPNYVIVLDGVAYSNLRANSGWLEGVTYDYVSVGSDYYSFIDLSEDNPVVIRSMNGEWYVKVFDGSTSHTVEMYQQNVTVDTIDSKFIGSDIARVSDIPNLSTYEFITTADIDAICGASIVAASEVAF